MYIMQSLQVSRVRQMAAQGLGAGFPRVFCELFKGEYLSCLSTDVC